MGRIEFNDIYEDGIDINKLTEYYKKRKKQEEEEEKKKEIKDKTIVKARKDAAVAIKLYLNALDVDGIEELSVQEIERNLKDLEKLHNSKSSNKSYNHRMYSATKEGNKDWNFDFEGDFTEQEKKEVEKQLRKWFA